MYIYIYTCICMCVEMCPQVQVFRTVHSLDPERILFCTWGSVDHLLESLFSTDGIPPQSLTPARSQERALEAQFGLSLSSWVRPSALESDLTL